MDVGDQIILRATFRNRAGDLESPIQVNAWVKEPDGTAADIVNMVEKSVGVWEGVFTVVVAGEHWWRVEGSGTITTASEKRFEVATQHVPHP